MRLKTYNLICHTLFWIKTLIALLCATGGLSYLSFRVYDLRNVAYGDPFIDSSLLSMSEEGALVPPGIYRYLGFSINWYKTEPSKYSFGGKRPIIFNYVPPFSLSDPVFYNSADLMNYAKKVRKVGGILHVTIVPDSTAETIDLAKDMPDRAYSKIEQDCKAINDMGVPVFLDFAPDMNANYHKYRMNPVAYKTGYQKMANLIRQSNLVYTVMVWTPSVGFDYPNIGAPFDGQLVAGALAALDTSANGQLGPEDDPYGPYYPGDEYVDWVGLSNNWIPNVAGAPNARNGPPPAGYFEGSIDGNPSFLNAINSQGNVANLNFYGRFALRNDKPMILSQVGVGITEGAPEFDEATIKTWKSTLWEQMLTPDFLTKYEKLKGFIITETERLSNIENQIIDFRILQPPTVRDFNTHISQVEVRRFLPYVGIIKAGKDGKISVIENIPEYE